MMTSLDQLWKLMEDLEPRFGGSAAARAQARTLPVNVWEDETSFHVEAELPGYRIEDLEIELTGPKLTLHGKRVELGQEGLLPLQRERRGGEFSRTLEFPVAMDGEGAHAQLKNGVLGIRLPKAKSAQPRKITVQSLDRTA
jgi:HSP20 family protein